MSTESPGEKLPAREMRTSSAELGPPEVATAPVSKSYRLVDGKRMAFHERGDGGKIVSSTAIERHGRLHHPPALRASRAG